MPEKNATSLLEYLSAAGNLSLPKPIAREEALQEILSLLNDSARDGGVTYSLYFGDQWGKSFYAVGLNNDWTEDYLPRDWRMRFDRFLRKYQRWLRNPRCCLGVWSNHTIEPPLIIVDISVLVVDMEVAKRFGREGNQIAIFFLQEGREILTAGTGEATEARLQRLEQEDRIPLLPEENG